MSSSKTETLNRQQLQLLIQQQAVKHAWLASRIKVSEKTLTRWLNGDVTRIRSQNLSNLAEALHCEPQQLVAASEVEVFSTDKNRDILVEELHNDSLLYQLLMSNKFRLAISLIKSTFHAKLPSGILASFYTKLGYAAVLHRKFKTAHKYFAKALLQAEQGGDPQTLFSVHMAFAMLYFLESDYVQCWHYLQLCQQAQEHRGSEGAHYHNTLLLYYLYRGEFVKAITEADACLAACVPKSNSVEKALFRCTALQLKGIAQLCLGEEKTALSLCQESLAVAYQSGYSRCIDIAKGYLAAVQATLGNMPEALSLSQESLHGNNKQDVSLPSLLCAAIYVQRKAGQKAAVEALIAELSQVTSPQSTAMAFAHYQRALLWFDSDINSQDTRAASYHSAALAQALLQELGLEYWLSAPLAANGTSFMQHFSDA